MQHAEAIHDEDAATLIARARRVTVKVGSSLLVGEGGVDRAWLAGLAADVAALRAEGRQVVLVSSGAVALGRVHLGLRHSRRLDLKQAAAAAGQPLLMRAWEEAMAGFGIPTAQLLLTVGDTESRRRWLNARATLEVLLGEGALPIVNENDSVATEELRYGDNDRLSARAAQMVRSDLLVLLSDVDGVYTGDPSRDPEARHIPFIDEIDETVERFAAGPPAGGVGSGGMRTKIAAARIARAFGCATLITTGRRERPIEALRGGGRATVIAARGSPARAYKQWIAGTLEPAGSLTVDEGAARALAAGRSLLPAGVTEVAGRFERGVCLRVVDGAGREIARGLTAYNAAEIAAIRRCPSREIEARLGYAGPDELIHRDDMVLM